MARICVNNKPLVFSQVVYTFKHEVQLLTLTTHDTLKLQRQSSKCISCIAVQPKYFSAHITTTQPTSNYRPWDADVMQWLQYTVLQAAVAYWFGPQTCNPRVASSICNQQEKRGQGKWLNISQVHIRGWGAFECTWCPNPLTATLGASTAGWPTAPDMSVSTHYLLTVCVCHWFTDETNTEGEFPHGIKGAYGLCTFCLLNILNISIDQKLRNFSIPAFQVAWNSDLLLDVFKNTQTYPFSVFG